MNKGTPDKKAYNVSLHDNPNPHRMYITRIKQHFTAKRMFNIVNSLMTVDYFTEYLERLGVKITLISDMQFLSMSNYTTTISN